MESFSEDDEVNGKINNNDTDDNNNKNSLKNKHEMMDEEKFRRLVKEIKRVEFPKYLPLNPKDSLKKDISSEEVIRLILQTLHSLGFKRTAEILEKESDVILENEKIISFKKFVDKGEWESAINSLPYLNFQNLTCKNTVQFLLYEQQYLELLENRDFVSALTLLQTHLSPLAITLSNLKSQRPQSPKKQQHQIQNEESESASIDFVQKLHFLSSLIMCKSSDELREKVGWGKTESSQSFRHHLLLKLHQYVTPSEMIADSRLASLLVQSVLYQEYQCLYHNVNSYDVNLFSNHKCKEFKFPERQFVLTGHKDEVWFAQFSQNGRYLASSSKDSSIIIWSVKPASMGKIIHSLNVSGVVTYIDWSSDNSKLLSCTSKFIYVWDTITGSCLNSFSHPNAKDIHAVAWFPGNLSFVSAGRGQFITLHSLQGEEVRTWEGSNIIDLIINKEGSKMIATSHDMKIHIFDLTSSSNTPIDIIQELDCITSVTLSSDSKFLLVSLVTRELHLWDIAKKKLVQKYNGANGKPYQHYIRSCFAGANESLVISGSEENGVLVWNRNQGNLLAVLDGHTKMVNAVCWNSAVQNMFASVSDDTNVRIWIFDDFENDEISDDSDNNNNNSNNNIIIM